VLFLAPNDVKDLHLPSDLAGVTAGYYEANRSDRNWRSAAVTFCTDVRQQIQKLGVAHNERQEGIQELAVKYDCCNYIKDFYGKINPERGKKKNEIFRRMRWFCHENPVNKKLLVGRRKTGFYMAFAAAIPSEPEVSDIETILSSVEPSGLAQTGDTLWPGLFRSVGAAP
jgi:hypothetical protein